MWRRIWFKPFWIKRKKVFPFSWADPLSFWPSRALSQPVLPLHCPRGPPPAHPAPDRSWALAQQRGPRPCRRRRWPAGPACQPQRPSSPRAALSHLLPLTGGPREWDPPVIPYLRPDWSRTQPPAPTSAPRVDRRSPVALAYKTDAATASAPLETLTINLAARAKP